MSASSAPLARHTAAVPFYSRSHEGTVGGKLVGASDNGGHCIGLRVAMLETPERELAKLIVETLNLPIEPSSIDPEAPLFHTGLGLDSIDALELAMAISQEYGFQLQAHDRDNIRIFASLRSLSAHIEANRTR